MLGTRYLTLRDFLHMKNIFLKMSSPNIFLMVPPIVLDLPSVVWVSTNVFWYYNDDLGLVGMSICPKKVFESVYTKFLCSSCVNPVWYCKGKLHRKIIFWKNPKKCDLNVPWLPKNVPERFGTFQNVLKVFRGVRGC